jgi:c-di-GMP-binding flagellar brake protein YcgR
MAVVKDARQFPRFSVDLKVAVSVGARKISTRSRDISRTGMCLVAQQIIPLETDIQIKLVLEFGTDGISEPLLMTGRVVWCTWIMRSYQIGVMFTGVDPERARHLQMFLDFLDGTLVQGRPTGDDEDTH